MRILLVYPAYPDTFWSFKHALKLINKKATHPPLGLLTVASLLPSNWETKLIDLNVETLNEDHIRWADCVFVSAMSVQRTSAEEVINLARRFGKKVVAGGPLFTAFAEDFRGKVDTLFIGEAENTIPKFVEDLSKGTEKELYVEDFYPDLTLSPPPAYHLIDFSKYTSMCIQFSRGCPFDCEFCEVTKLFGHKVRTKKTEQILRELENLYTLGWRGSVFFVDDNFIGAKRKVKEELLPAIIDWQRAHRYPFYFYTQVSINLADDEELIDLMVEAGFNSVFIGIETPSEESLKEANKKQNTNRALVESIRKIQKKGLEVMGGFILGFDSDPPDIFQKLIDFINQSRIVIAMVGLLNAPPGTKLYKRLAEEKRIRPFFSGNNTDLETNIVPKMGLATLVEGYKEVIRTLYSEKNYYKRIEAFIEDFTMRTPFRIDREYLRYNFGYLKGVIKIFLKFGILGNSKKEFWSLIYKTLTRKPQNFSIVLAQIASGYHFRRIFKEAFV